MSITWLTGTAGGIWLIVMRIFQGVGAALLMANSAAILTDAFPPDRRGFALGINQAAAISGTFIGLLLGGLLAPINWRLIFLVSVPIGLFATIWGYFSLHEVESGSRARIDWAGNITFAIGLILVMVGITYGIEPYGGHPMGWTNPVVLLELGVGVAFLVLFCFIEVHTDEPMFRLQLFKIRAFSAGVFASFLGALGRGGLMFMLIIWLQGIWLPRHGYTFDVTPLWAGIALIPLTAGLPHRRARWRASCPTATGRAPSPPSACSARPSASRSSSWSRSTSPTPSSPCCCSSPGCACRRSAPRTAPAS